MGYVALSRAREQTRLYTTANELEPDAPPHRPEPARPIDRLADALAAPAAETLALDLATNQPDTPARAGLAAESRQHRARRLTLEKERLDASRQFHQTNRKLAGLGLVSRTRYANRQSRVSTGSSNGSPRSSAGRASARSTSPALSHGPTEA